MTDWAAWLACTVCEAKQGGACFTLLAGGPDALPARYADVPHSSRKPAGSSRLRTADSTAKPTGASTAAVARRAAKKTAATASGWAAVAKRQGKM